MSRPTDALPAAERLQLSRFGPRERRESKGIRRWAEVGFSAKLDAGLSYESFSK
jgi:hypothetical protein